jgi:hypothetical protein
MVFSHTLATGYLLMTLIVMAAVGSQWLLVSFTVALYLLLLVVNMVVVIAKTPSGDYVVNDPYGSLNDGYTGAVTNGKGACI